MNGAEDSLRPLGSGSSNACAVGEGHAQFSGLRRCSPSGSSRVAAASCLAASESRSTQRSTQHVCVAFQAHRSADHDLALSIEKEDGATIKVKSNSDDMELHRVVTTNRRGCKNSLNVHSHRIDAGPIYGTEEAYRENTLREPGTCFLRTADGNFLSVTTSADADGRFFFIAGDVRVSEHAFLAAQHTVWVREHNRICEKVNRKKRYKNMSPDDKFTLVHNVVIAKFQQVVLTEFLPALGITKQDVEKAQPMVTLKGVSVEFSIAYRLGHDLIGNTVDGITIADAFNAEV